MLKVSPEWQAASREQFRYQAYLEVSLEVTPPGLRQNATIETDATFRQSGTDGILYSMQTAIPYVTLEPNRWRLNGKYNLLPEGVTTTDWWSEKAVDTNDPIVLTFTFDKEYDIPGIFFVWDSINRTHPNSIGITAYDNVGTELLREMVSVDSYQGFFEQFAVDKVKKINLFIFDWQYEFWRARIETILFGFKIDFDSYNKGRISGATQTTKSDPTCKDLPHASLSITVRNTDGMFDPTLKTGVSKYLARQQVIQAKWQFYTAYGELEDAPVQRYLTESFNIPKDSKDVTIEAVSRLELLDADFKLGTYSPTPRTLSSIAKYVLRHSDIFQEVEGQEPWSIPAIFDQIVTSAPIPSMHVNAILQLIALAGGSWLTTDTTNGYVKFAYANQPVSPYCAIDLMQENGDPVADVSDRLKSVSVGIYKYNVANEVTDINTSEYFFSGDQTFEIKYSSEFATNVSASVSGAIIVAQQYYASYAVLTLRANAADSAVNVKLRGNVVNKEVSYIETYNDPLVTDGRRITVENPFITSLVHANRIGEAFLPYFLKRTRYTVDYLGYPQMEPLDRIHQKTVYGEGDVVVTGNTIKFNGGWTGTAETV